jgi:hypothetical protein
MESSPGYGRKPFNPISDPKFGFLLGMNVVSLLTSSRKKVLETHATARPD